MAVDILSLPPEIVIQVLSLLRIPEIHSLSLLSRSWNAFVDVNASAIFRQAAVLHNFAPNLKAESTFSDEAATHAGGWLDGVQSWKELCQRWYRLEDNWLGKGDVICGNLFATGRDVHRIKVDESQRAIICSHRSGGITVTDLRDDQQTLWSLPTSYVREHAHVELSEGFLIFDRVEPEHTLEVWRRWVDYDEFYDTEYPNPHPNPPLQAQLVQSETVVRFLRKGANSRQATPNFPTAIPPDAPNPEAQTAEIDKRGIFKPWALLRTPNHMRAYRAIGGQLLVGSEIGKEVYVFNLRTAELIETIPLKMAYETDALFHGASDPAFMYVELAPRHAFVCADKGLLILPRPPGQHEDDDEAARPASQTSSRPHDQQRSARGAVFPPPEMHLTSRMMVKQLAIKLDVQETVVPEEDVEPLEQGTTQPTPVQLRMPQPVTPAMGALVPMGGLDHTFIAVHLSSDGRDFAALTEYGVLFLVRGFERAVRGEVAWEDITAFINMGDDTENLCLEHGRVIVQTSRGSIYVFTLDSTIHTRHSSTRPPPSLPIRPFPHLLVHRLVGPRLWNSAARVHAHCLQATQTAVYISWNRRSFAGGMGMQEAVGAWITLCYMDLTPTRAGRVRGFIHEHDDDEEGDSETS